MTRAVGLSHYCNDGGKEGVVDAGLEDLSMQCARGSEVRWVIRGQHNVIDTHGVYSTYPCTLMASEVQRLYPHRLLPRCPSLIKRGCTHDILAQ